MILRKCVFCTLFRLILPDSNFKACAFHAHRLSSFVQTGEYRGRTGCAYQFSPQLPAGIEKYLPILYEMIVSDGDKGDKFLYDKDDRKWMKADLREYSSPEMHQTDT